MYGYEKLPSEWFTSRKRPRSYQYLPPMSRPVSKSFNRISDFIYPDTVHVRLYEHQQLQRPQQPPFRRYARSENYSLPVLNRNDIHRRDLIVVERLPFAELENVDLLYREQDQSQQYHRQQQQQQQRYGSNQFVQRRYSSIIDEGRTPFNDRTINGLTNRSAAYRERIRDRRKRHTTDNAYHSMMRSMLEEEEDEELQRMNIGEPNYASPYKTTLDPILDAESMASLRQRTNNITGDEWNRQTHIRVPVNGTIPIVTERERPRGRQESSSLSSRDSSSDTDITARHPTTVKYSDYRQDSSFISSSKGPPAISMPPPAVWERLQSDPVRLRHEPDIFIPIEPASADINNQETTSYSHHQITSAPIHTIVDYRISDQTSNINAPESDHHVSLCMSDVRTSLYIDEDVLNSTKTTNSQNNGKAVIKTFIDRIIRRLQHFKRSLDAGLIHVRKRNTLVNGPIVSTDYRSYSETTRRKHIVNQLNDSNDQQEASWMLTSSAHEDTQFAQPYFLIKPQSTLLLPNEMAKFKCCFGGYPLPTIVWSHNDSRVSEILLTGSPTSHYRTHKLHDIYYLDIGPVTVRDNGQIKCTIMNKLGREEAVAQLTVVDSASDATPCITEPLNDVTIIEGRPLKLSCTISGLQVTVNWFHNNKLISPVSQSKTDYQGENSIFTLSQCMRSDTGTVDCLVKNRFGEAKTSCRIEVVNDPAYDR